TTGPNKHGLFRRPLVEALHTPASLAVVRPDLVSPADLRPRFRSRLASKVRRLHLPVPGPRTPLPAVRQFRHVRAFCLRAVREALHGEAPDFLFVAPQTTPLALTLGNRPWETRLVLIAHAVEWERMRGLADARRGLGGLGLRWEAGRARRFER